MAAAGDDDGSVLSDVDEDDVDPAPTTIPGDLAAADNRVRDLLAELDQERCDRKAAEDARSELQTNFNRLKVFAQDVIRKRDEVLREKEEAARSTERATTELSESLRLKEDALKQKDEALRRQEEALKQKDEALRRQEEALKQKDEALRRQEEALKQKDSLRSEVEISAQMLVRGIENISANVSAFKNFSAGGLPRSQKYTGMPAVAYGVIHRANEIVVELVRQIEAANRSRDQSREQMEQRNYEIAIDVSQLEATIGGLREDVSKKALQIESLEKLVSERDTKIAAMEQELAELRKFGEECNDKLKILEVKVEAQRPLLINQLNYISKAYQQIHEIIRISDVSAADQSDLSESLFMWKEMDLDENLRTSLDGTVSIYELAKVATEKVKEGVEERSRELNALSEKVVVLLTEKQHIGTLLRSTLSSKTNEVLLVAENGLREAGIDLRFNGRDNIGSWQGDDDEVYNLAGALENTVRASQLEVIELQHLVEALRAESSLLKAQLDAQAKEIGRQKNQIKELEEKERLANENVEGLMTDIAAAEEEIARWKVAAEQEAAAGRAVEQEFLSQLSAVQKEFDKAKQALVELENKLKFKEETAAAAMTARDAAENSLRLADLRSARLRERLEELTRQLEELDIRNDSRMRDGYRYMCWPWQWLGLNSVRYQTIQESPNETELSEPLI